MSSGHRDYYYLEWIARLPSHIPERGTQLVHYYGAYSNAHRGIAFQREAFIEVPPEDEPYDPPRPDSPWLAARRKSWARLIRRVYEVDPFLCRCGERMRVVSTPDVCAGFGLIPIPWWAYWRRKAAGSGGGRCGVSGRLIQPPKHNVRMGFQSLPTIPGKKELTVT